MSTASLPGYDQWKTEVPVDTYADGCCEDFPIPASELKQGAYYMDACDGLILGVTHIASPHGTLVAVDACEDPGYPVYDTGTEGYRKATTDEIREAFETMLKWATRRSKR